MNEEYRALFHSEMEKDCVLMRGFIEVADWPGLALLAHRIRGRARVMGFDEFEDICTDLEDRAQAEDLYGVGLAMESLARALLDRR